MEDDAFYELSNVINKIYYKEISINNETLEKLLIKYFELLFLKLFKTSITPNISFDNDSCWGEYLSPYDFSFNPLLLDEIQKSNFLHVFDTVIHEYNHYGHHVAFNRHISLFNLLREKELTLRDGYHYYYDENYENIIYEIDSYKISIKYAVLLLKSLGIQIPKEEINQYIKEELSIRSNPVNTLRTFKGDVYDLEDIFNLEINYVSLLSCSEFLNIYLYENPNINIEYKLEAGYLVKRSLDELKELYNNYKKGELKLIGNKDEIEDLFYYLITKELNKEPKDLSYILK